MRALIIAIAALTFTGCAGMMGVASKSDTISFDRGSFAFLVADTYAIIRQQCKDKKLPAATCARAEEQYRELRRQITTPPPVTPSGMDTEQMMRLLGVLIGAAT